MGGHGKLCVCECMHTCAHKLFFRVECCQMLFGYNTPSAVIYVTALARALESHSYVLPVVTVRQSTNQANGRGDCNGKGETCLLIMPVLVVNTWRYMGRLGALVQAVTSSSLAKFRFCCLSRVPHPPTMLFRVTMLRQETPTGCHSVTPRCCFPGALFLGISKQCWYQSPFVLVFAFWLIPMAWSS